MVHERREEHRFLLSAWVFLPDHWHAVFYPPFPLTVSGIKEAIKGGATKRINHRRRECGTPFQPHFLDRALHTVRKYQEKAEYIDLNPVKAGWVDRPEDWPWSSVHDYTGNLNDNLGGLSVDRITIPANPAPGSEAMRRRAADERKQRVRLRYPAQDANPRFRESLGCTGPA